VAEADHDVELLEIRQPRRRSRLSRALLNVWNAVIVVGGAAAAAATGKLWILSATAAAEAAWLGLAAHPILNRKLFAGQYAAEDAAFAAKERAALVATLPTEDKDRLGRLELRRTDILSAARQNKSLEGAFAAADLYKLDELVNGFLDLASACARWERYLRAVDYDDLEGELRKAETDAGRALDDDGRSLARKNLAVLTARKDQLGDMRRKVGNARAQLDLIENSFKLIGDQVLVMRSPSPSLGRELDDLIVGVEAIREMTRDDDKLLAARRQAQTEKANG
jgi:hypothetical protein